MVHIKEGFDFLGFHIRRMLFNPRLNSTAKGNIHQKTVLIIKPSKKSVRNLLSKVSKIIIKSNPLVYIIKHVNPILRGWAEHKRVSYHSQEVFITIDHII